MDVEGTLDHVVNEYFEERLGEAHLRNKRKVPSHKVEHHKNTDAYGEVVEARTLLALKVCPCVEQVDKLYPEVLHKNRVPDITMGINSGHMDGSSHYCREATMEHLVNPSEDCQKYVCYVY